MDSRPFFIFGDLFANILVGAVAGWLSWLAVGTEWNMFLAMLVAMAIGMAIALLLFFPLGMAFGAMEVMLPTMFGGMMSGMAVGMSATMGPMSAREALTMGAGWGLGCLLLIWLLNGALRGRRQFGEEPDRG